MVNKNDFNAKVLIEVIGDTTLTCVECSLIGSAALIDEIVTDFKDEVRGKICRMYQDKTYYIARGGWHKFTIEENRQYLKRALNEIEKQGYEFNSIDFYDKTNGVLFLKVTKIKRSNIHQN